MKMKQRYLDTIVNNEAKEYAMYTVENRAIPSLMDGLKPVQRFFIHVALEMAKGDKDKFHKLASIAGQVADAGYHHGEASAQEAGALMANTWNNNLALLDGQGNFGSRLVQEAAASRYIFCRISDNFRKIYKDIEICPRHKDAEHKPPRFYLPIIPTVLLNGVRGIATGYSTRILPHSFESIVECTKLAIEGNLTNKEPLVEFPKFKGTIITTAKGYELHGKYDMIGRNTLYISEIPYKWDRASYVEHLDEMEAKGWITYEDDCSSNGFGFKVKLKKEFKLGDNPDDTIMKEFALIEKVSQFIVVVDENGKLNASLTKASDVINYFVQVRMKYIDERISYNKEKSNELFMLAYAKAKFIKMIIDGELVISGKSRKELANELSTHSVLCNFVSQLLQMSVYHITDDEYQKLKQQAIDAKKQYEYWCNTDSKTEYLKDLESLV